MPADLDQFRRDDSHGAVIGGEGLVQLRHEATNGGSFFNEIDIVTGIREIKGGLHTGDTASNHHDGTGHPFGFIAWHHIFLSTNDYSLALSRI